VLQEQVAARKDFNRRRLKAFSLNGGI